MFTGSGDQCPSGQSGVTQDEPQRSDCGFGGKKLYVVGIGPGDIEQMSLKAYRLLQEVDVIVGYRTYLDLIQDLIQEEQTLFSTGMGREIERAEKALSFVQEGNRVALVSSGDPGVYGMAGLILELIQKKGLEIEPEIVPGITASSAAAASLGAPLMHDFATISLSDLLTSWESIEKRLRQAARADFVIVLYNPRSSKRKTQFHKACEILREYKSDRTPVGLVHSAGRGEENIIHTTLAEIPEEKVDMLTTVIVGNNETRFDGKFMVTPRGYRL